jgi:hypothetical protein
MNTEINNKLIERFFNETCIIIPEIFISPLQIRIEGDYNLYDFFEDIEEEDLASLGLEINIDDFYTYDDFLMNDFIQAIKEEILDRELYGIFAKVNIPKIEYKSETRCEIHQNYYSTFYIFAKSINELMLKSLEIYDKHDEDAKNKYIRM